MAKATPQTASIVVFFLLRKTHTRKGYTCQRNDANNSDHLA